MSTTTPPRPRQVTTAAVLGVVGSVLLVVSLFDAIGRVRSVEMRSAVEEFLAEPPGNGLGISTDSVLDLLHVMVLFNGALAATAAVLAVYVAQRHQAARVGFSVAAALLLFTAPLSGGVMAMLVALGATMLWSRPARDWFAGREPSPVVERASDGSSASTGEHRSWPAPDPRHGVTAPTPERDESRPQAPPHGHAEGQPAPQWPVPAPGSQHPDHGGAASDQTGSEPAAATYPFGTRPDPQWAPPGAGQQPGVPPWAVGTAQDPDRRPGSVTAAAIITWVFAGLTGLGYLAVVLMLMVARQPLVDAIQADPQFESLPMSTDDLLAVLWVMSAVSIFWSVSAVALAVLAFRRVGWARTALVVSAASAMMVSLLAFPFGLLHGAAAATAFALLLGKRSSAWFARRPAPSFPPGPPQGPTGGQSGQHGQSQPGQYGQPPYPGPPPGQQPGAAQGPPPGAPQQPPAGSSKPPVW